MSADPRAADGEAILVTLSALVLAGPDAPVAAPDAAGALERLASFGRPVVLAGDTVAGRRLPDDPDARERWVRAALGRDVPIQVAPFAAAGVGPP